MQGTWFHPWSKKILHATEQLSLCAEATEPVLWIPCSVTKGGMARRSPRTTAGEQPPLATTRESPHAATKT